MAPARMLCCSSSLNIIIIITSILFLVVWITFWTLCTYCYRYPTPESPEYSKEGEVSSPIPPLETPKDEWSANRSLDTEALVTARTHTVVYCQAPKVHPHSSAESHSYFREAIMPTPPTSPAFSSADEHSLYPRMPCFAPLPSIQPCSAQPPETTAQSCVTPVRPDPAFLHHTHCPEAMRVSEEHPYECVGMVTGCESPPSPVLEDQYQLERESSYQAVMELAASAVCHKDPPLTVTDRGQVVEESLLFPPLTTPQNDTGEDSIYAAVNRKNKSQGIRESPVSQDNIKLDMDDTIEETAPPIPEKRFE